MKNLWVVATLLVVGTTLIAVDGLGTTAEAAIASIHYEGSYSPGQIVKLWRGLPANIVVKGQFVDQSNRTEIVGSTGAPVPGFSASIIARQGGSLTQITIFVLAPISVPLGQYTLRIRYPIEPSGPDQFTIRLYDLGEISSITLDTGSPGDLKQGVRYGFTATGRRLSNAQFGALHLADSIAGIQMVQRSDTMAKFSLEFTKAGQYGFGFYNFYDFNLSPAPTFRGPASYGGSGTFGVTVRINPVVTSLSPRVAQPVALVRIAGANLKPEGHTVKLEYKTKYFGVERRFLDLAGDNTALTFRAPQNVQPDSLVLLYTKTGEQQSTPVPIPSLYVVERPDIKGATEGLAPWTAAGQTYDTIRAGRVTLVGQHLVPTPGVQTTVTFGNTPLKVQSISYAATNDAQGKLDGRDLLSVTVPDLPANQIGPLTVVTPGGTATLPNILYVDKPTVTKVQEETGVPGAPYRDVLAQTLIRGKIARLVGSSLRVSIPPYPTPGRTMIQQGKVKVSGIEAQVFAFSASPPSPNEADYLDFTVPANATSGQLTVSTFGGETVVGSFQVVAVTGLPLASFTLVPASVVGGGQVTGSAAFTGAVSPGGTGGLLEIFGNPEAMQAIAPLNITSNPMTVTITTKPVSITRNETISARSGGTFKSTTLTLLPLQPTALTLNPTAVVGGLSLTGTVQMNGSVPASAGVTVALVSSDTTTATVPPTATVNGSTATFTINTAVVPSARSVTISATAAGLPRSATLTVGPASLAGVSVNPATVIASHTVTGTVTMTGPVSGRTVTLASSELAARVPASVTVNGTSATFQVATSGVTAPRSATITATSGGVTRTTTLTVNPLTVQSVTISPASIRAGATATGTVTLSAAWGGTGSLTVPLTSSNTSVATVPGGILFAPGQTSQIFAVTARSPIAQSTRVTIRANMGTLFSEANLDVTP